jgi:F0F1-type ATP synthase assembly protein I
VPKDNQSDEVEQALDLGRYAGLGFQFAAVLLAFGALGWWVDGLLGTRPWLLIVGVFVGAVGAFMALLRSVPKARSRSSNSSSNARSESSSPDDRS